MNVERVPASTPMCFLHRPDTGGDPAVLDFAKCLSNRARSVQWMTFEGVKPSALARLTQHRTSSHPLLRSPIPPSTVQIPIADLHRTTASSSPAVSSSEAYQTPTADCGNSTP